jgi:H+/Cl- antiporter ClcA
MKKSAALGGLAGAAALTLLHEIIKKEDSKAPRMDLLGMMALSKLIRRAGKNPPPERKLYLYTMLGDLVSNALYYSLAGVGKRKTILQKGTALGIAAGLGALFLPKPLHLNEAYSNRTTRTQVMTVAYYLIGSLVAAALIKRLQKND